MRSIVCIIFVLVNTVSYGQGVTTHYINKSSVVFDTDAQAYIDTLHTEVSDLGSIYGTLTDAEVQTAINQFFLDIKGNGSTTNNTDVFSDLTADYPLIGATAGAHKFNCISPGNTDADYRVTWVGTITHDELGILSDGTSGYGNTHINPSDDLTLNSTHFSFYIQDAIQDGQFMGVVDGTDYFILGANGTSWIWRCYSSTGQILVTNTDQTGFVLGNRSSSTTNKLIINDTDSNTDATVTGGLPDRELYILVDNINGTPDKYIDEAISHITIGNGLTSDQETDLYDAIQTLQTTLGRDQ